ncbi:YuiB family protein [Sutcliffiella horikoshii]|uniref:YuiB family protein n=1 Tax=Sutcliffiella horikoshii TaxID=79883 RepID=UPI001F1A777C|nr:YuiB family protein [Sutcliffiella horikoshii]
MVLNIPILLISVVLFFVLFFGIGFLLNMLLRMSWIMAIIYPLVCVWIIAQDDVRLIDYFRQPGTALSTLGSEVASLQVADITILISGFLGAICSGIVIRMLRKNGYQMF